LHLARVLILIVQRDRDVVPVESVLSFLKRVPEPKRLIVPGGLHTSTYVGGENFDQPVRVLTPTRGGYAGMAVRLQHQTATLARRKTPMTRLKKDNILGNDS
jgi:hypothetical protein